MSVERRRDREKEEDDGQEQATDEGRGRRGPERSTVGGGEEKTMVLGGKAHGANRVEGRGRWRNLVGGQRW